ncbi:glycoside hydrolase family 43 protein [Candidatus Neomicrothrix sp.]|uniref:glycoside hydrolase family 43 protein n=1 Tax=Candidatus Neomicrothrix sp. TaxID=2719034 RepID=UPI001B5DB55B|nr:glycoside hydrolase family 43 protein [Candidatus Microthrix sp.]MBK6501463.1 family 43 glycosylhydrolase [Candidatus Microthrix sp.]MBK7020070.1 family 43 glycosylhydrolase [Candidatus Microthrix sp.]MBK7322667.1 family 43 glycosylhydrolase [Candidatus Microthrix sp.]MBL0202912.1 family 43 glycosylhydrolase [Candidatus Microthrix sp.]MBP6136445.1 family 43 glycosylhydrolase [Candidatus Microthrix sp.]
MAKPAGDAMATLPSWTEPGLVWAPSVLQTDDDGFVLSYTSLDSRSGLQCVGAARASSPLGPFVDGSDDPFVCQRELGGTIDASPFVDDDGTPYLLFKNDGNCCDITTQLWTQQLSADGMTLVGDAIALLETTEDWEGPLIEGPSMTTLGDSYWLLYSAYDWNSADYSVGLAQCESPVGPCTKRDGPWLANHGDASGPGGAEDFTDADGRRWMVYHAWVTDKIGYETGGERSLFAVPLDLRSGEPVARGLSEDSAD